MQRWLPGRRRDERGVIAIVIALITCFVFVPLGALAVDIGVQRVARRDAQSVADMVALDLARQLDGRTYAQIQPTLQTLANKSLARNGHPAGAPTVVAQLGTVDTKNYDANNPDAYFTPMTLVTGVPNAVKVTATGRVSFSFDHGSGGVTRTAIGLAQGQVCFAVGSWAANLDAPHVLLLNSLLNDSLHLSLVSYSGLASANVTLLGLATALGVGTVDGLLNLDHLTLGQLYLASAQALQAQGGSAANVTLLNQLATASVALTSTIKFSDLIDISSGDTAALDSSINLLNIVAGSAMIANGTNALAVPSLTVGVPNLTSTTVSLKVIEAPAYRCGRVGDSVSTSQVDLTVDANVANLSILGLLGVQTQIHLAVHLATATATITNVFCGATSGADVAVASSLSQLYSNVPMTVTLLGLDLVDFTAGVNTTAAAATNTVQLRVPPDTVPVTKSTGSGTVLSSLDASTVSHGPTHGTLPLGVTLTSITNALLSTIITPIVNPLINNLNTIVDSPLVSMLGLKLGGADVIFTSAPTCISPTLAG